MTFLQRYNDVINRSLLRDRVSVKPPAHVRIK